MRWVRGGTKLRVVAIFNQEGGTFRTTDMAEYQASVLEVFGKAGHQIECHLVQGEDLVPTLERVALSGEFDCLVAGGGDGTISAAARVAWKSGLVLGVVPAGTMNLFARSIGLPLDIWEVLETLAAGHVVQVDIASANGQSFIHQFSAGMRPRMVRLRDAMNYGSRLGKIRATIRAAFTAMLKPPRFDVDFQVHGDRHKQIISAISVSNNEFGQDPLMFAEHLTGGHLGLYLAEPLSFRTAARLAFDIVRGRLKENDAVTALKTTEIHLHFPRHRHGIRCVMDGELLAMDQEISLKIHPRELNVLTAAAR